MHDLQAISPLGGVAPRTDVVAGVILTEVTGFALASVAARLGGEAPTMALVAQQIGAAAPGPGRAAGHSLSAFWVGPDQWMIEAPFETHEDLVERLVAQAGGHASITEQSDGWCRFDLRGPGLAEIFALLCALDFPSFTGGEATRTSIEHLGCFVICRAVDHASVIGPRSAAGSLHHALLTAMRAAL
ncbi:MAG: sarcosine oxidase subunit gamma [Roseicyclus sp.]|nr:sarcosine oxidase subunit gamma [Roseicyclus sp.]